MALFEGKTPAERNKMIAAVVMPLLALIFVVKMFSGPSRPNSTAPTPAPKARGARPNAPPDATSPSDLAQASDADISPVVYEPTAYGGAEAGRNIFAFYVRPTPTPGPPAPPPTPTPTPPVVLASLAPQSVFARTAGFTLQLSGDKFGPTHRAYIDGQELTTQYKSVQQLSATVPAALIAGPGQRQVVVRTPDGQLFSNTVTLTVMEPPRPTYTYVGFLRRRQGNTAVLKDGKNELHSVIQGDLVEGRFRVVDISDRGVEVVDKDLNIKHTMPFVDARGQPGSAPGRVPGSIQPPPVDPEGDDEP
ncbi:MAG TPA: hypothetical protein VF508_13425 [Pyrinomonadaceae bacterium]